MLANSQRDISYRTQAGFRALLQAMARPGNVVDIPGSDLSQAPVLSSAMAMLLLTLCDSGTRIWFPAAGRDDKKFLEWIRFQTDCQIIDEPTRADFVIVLQAAALPALSELTTGTMQYPDRSATLLVALDSFDGGPAMELSGPGIQQSATLAPKELPAGFTALWRENNQLFPMGVDCILCDETAVACITRTTRIVAIPERV